VYLAEGDGILGGEAAHEHKDRNHNAATSSASWSRQSRAEENDDEQQDVGSSKVLPKSFVGAKGMGIAAGARAAVVRVVSSALRVGRASTAFSAHAKQLRGAAVVGAAHLPRQERLQHLPGISRTLNAHVAITAWKTNV
jgi:hypothetical protein